MQTIPDSPDEIDSSWLEAALAERHPNTRVASVEVLERHEATNSHARLEIAYGGDSELPDTMFCKLLPCDPARRDAIAGTGMGRREVGPPCVRGSLGERAHPQRLRTAPAAPCPRPTS